MSLYYVNYHSQPVDEDWINLDPLAISCITRDIHTQLEELLCTINLSEGDVHQILRRHYGPRPFKCAYVECAFRRHGFESSKLRNAHNKNHFKPWDCNFKGCEFEKVGFLSRKMRDDHVEQAHSQKQSLLHDTTTEVDKATLQQYGYELVKADDVAGIDALAAAGVLVEPVYLGGLLECVTRHASPKMLRSLVAVAKGIYTSGERIQPDTDYKALLLGPAASHNLDVFQQILELRPADWGGNPRFVETSLRIACMQVLNRVNEEMYDILYNIFEQDTLKLKEYYITCPLMISLFPQEQLLLRLWEQVPSHVWAEKRWQEALSHVAGSTCSIKLAKFILDQGVPINAQARKTSLTALHRAVRRNTRAGAELARFLLVNGADPEAIQENLVKGKTVRKKVRDEKGAQTISQWLGISWDELVAETAAKRQELVGQSQE